MPADRETDALASTALLPVAGCYSRLLAEETGQCGGGGELACGGDLGDRSVAGEEQFLDLVQAGAVNCVKDRFAAGLAEPEVSQSSRDADGSRDVRHA